MPTALVITADRDYGSACFAAFRARDLFPVAISTIDRALPLLRQFRVDVFVIHTPGQAGAAATYDRLKEHAPRTPILVITELPAPQVLAVQLGEVIRDAIQRELTTPREPTAGESRASSSSRGVSSV